MPGFVDRRELILLRIKAILDTLPGIVGAFRNRGDFQPVDTETKLDILPVAVLLDGAEHIVASGRPDTSTGFPTTAVMSLEPQIFIVLKPTSDINNLGQGEALSNFRAKLLDLIYNDSALWGLIGSNGKVQYRGCITDMQSGSAIQGQMQLDFAFEYRLDPNELRSS